jgi:alpha-ketoglutarate-dependent taurine dioxygenase
VDRLDVIPLTGRIGAEIRGVRLEPDLDSATADAIHQAWLKHKVIFLHDQGHLDDQAQEGLAWIFGGESVAHPTVPAADGTAYIYELDSRIGAANYWHTDLTWADSLPRGAILRAVEVPPFGGDTLWANTATAYADLPRRLRALADRGWAMHSNASKAGMDVARSNRPGRDRGRQQAFWSAFQSTVFETWHPLAHVHPETREPCLLLGKFLRRVAGMTKPQSARLYASFQYYITRPENTVRWHWATGDVAVWDNRATQHYAIADYGEARRIMRRVSIDGEPTRSLDGRRARTRRRSAPRGRSLAPRA